MIGKGRWTYLYVEGPTKGEAARGGRTVLFCYTFGHARATGKPATVLHTV